MKLKGLKKLELFQVEELQSLVKLEYQGFCNTNYKLTSSKDTYLLREFKSDASVNISREFEFMIQKKAYKKNIAPKPIYLDINKSFMITEFLKGKHKSTLSKKELKKLIDTIKKLHKIKSRKKPYDLKKDFKYYDRVLKDKHSKKLIKSSYKELKKIKGLSQKYVTTHHDLNPKNIVFYKNSIKFIDWEYAGVNSCFFDLATICVEFSLNKHEQKYLLKVYFKKAKKEYLKPLKIYIKLYKVLCELWFKTLN